MASEIANEKDPLDASLEKVLPGVHQWHRINNAEMSKLQTLVKDAVEGLTLKVDDMHSTMLSTREDTSRQLSAAFMQMSQYFLQHGNSVAGDPSRISDALQQVQVGAMEYIAEEAETANDNEGETMDPADLHALFRMVPKHIVLLGLMHEWYGVGDYYDSYGGIEGRNKTYKARWRKKCHLNAMHFSRTERTVRAVEAYAKNNSMDKFDAAVALQQVFEIDCKTSVTNFVLWAQQEGLIAKSKSRGTRKKQTTDNQMDTSSN